MKLLLICAVHEDKWVEAWFPPLGLGSISACLKQSIPGVEIGFAYNDSDDIIETFQPDVVGIMSVTQNFGVARRIAMRCKQRGIPVIVGGHHISALPETLPGEIDVGVIGEGEATAVELMRLLIERGLDPERLAHVSGIVYHDKAGLLKITSPRSVIDPLDQLPLADRDLIFGGSGPIEPPYLFSSRGCPYECTFCSGGRFWPKVRFFSPDYVVREVKEIIQKYHPPHISFWDDLFTASKSRLREIVKLVEKERLNHIVSFAITCRANLLDEETVDLLKRMNVVRASLGLESGSNKILRYLKGGSVSVEQNRRAVELLDRAGIVSIGSFIIGAPDETMEDIEQTYNFIRNSKLARTQAYLLTPLPGTPLWDHALERGLVGPDMEWDRLQMDYADDMENKVILSERLSRQEILRQYKRLQRLGKWKAIKAIRKRVLRKPGEVLPNIARYVSRSVHNLGVQLKRRALSRRA